VDANGRFARHRLSQKFGGALARPGIFEDNVFHAYQLHAAVGLRLVHQHFRFFQFQHVVRGQFAVDVMLAHRHRRIVRVDGAVKQDFVTVSQGCIQVVVLGRGPANGCQISLAVGSGVSQGGGGGHSRQNK